MDEHQGTVKGGKNYIDKGLEQLSTSATTSSTQG